MNKYLPRNRVLILVLVIACTLPQACMCATEVTRNGVSSFAGSGDSSPFVTAGYGKGLPAADSVVIPLCTAGTPFGPDVYAQNTRRSDPMVSTCTWDGTGRVFISGDPGSLTRIYADDGYSVSIQPSGARYDAEIHSGVYHPVIELTGGMRPGNNTITIIVENWNGLSMLYGEFIPGGVRQTPTIVQVRDASTAAIPAHKTGTLQVTKKIYPSSVKAGTDTKVTITVYNNGTYPVHDVEIADATLPEFPVIDGTPFYTASVIEPNETRIITYEVRATKAGSFRFNRTTAMYADPDDNYQIVYSGYETISVLASIVDPEPRQEDSGFFSFFASAADDLIAWING